MKALVLTSVLLGWAGVRATAAQQVPDSLEPVVIELQIGRLASRTVPAYRVHSEALIPLTQFLQLAEVLFHLSPEGRLVATLDPGHKRLIVDVARDTMSFGTHRIRLEPVFRSFDEGEIYVGAERLGDLLGLLLQVNWAELTVTVMDPATLPIARRMEREAARVAFLKRAETSRADMSLGLERPRLGGLVFDYSLLAPSQNVVAGGAYTAALGADAFGGSLEVGVQSVGPLDSGNVRLQGSWTGVWHRPELAEIRVGTGLTSGPRARQQHGVFVTNAPFVRPSLIGAVPFVGRLEPGWSIEAYRGGDLVAYDSTDAVGRFLMDLPVRYGENPVDFVAYGPFGEIRQFNRTYRVSEALLPARRFEYGVSGGACVEALCQNTANVDLRYGVSRRLTVAAGADQIWRDTQPDLFHPYFGVTASPTTAWAVAVEGVADAFGRAAVQYEPSMVVRVGASYSGFAQNVTAPLFTAPGRRSQWAVTGFWRPAPERGYAFFDATIEGERTDAGSSFKARVGASAITSFARVLPYARIEHQPAARLGSYVGVTAFVLPRPQLGNFFGRLWMRGTAELERVAGVTNAGLVLGRDLFPGVRLEAGANWMRGSGTAVVVTVASYLPSVRTVTTIDRRPGESATATQFVQGSVLWDRSEGRIAAAPGPALQRAGLAGRVFLDENADGVWNPGEPPVPGVRVLVGTLSATADSNGVYRVWDLIPFEPVIVRVDSLSLDSPLLVPSFGAVSVVPGPNRFRSLDVPIAVAGVLEGRVVRGEGTDRRGMGGVIVMLTNKRTGGVRRFVTFTDGDFYVLGVIAGDYELKIDPKSLEALDMESDAMPLTLAATAEGVGRSGLVLLLKPKN